MTNQVTEHEQYTNDRRPLPTAVCTFVHFSLQLSLVAHKLAIADSTFCHSFLPSLSLFSLLRMLRSFFPRVVAASASASASRLTHVTRCFTPPIASASLL